MYGKQSQRPQMCKRARTLRSQAIPRPLLVEASRCSVNRERSLYEFRRIREIDVLGTSGRL